MAPKNQPINRRGIDMTFDTETTRIGFIGLGVMGRSMAGHLLARGYDLSVYTRTPETAKDLTDKGAKWQASPAELARNVDLVITMVGYPSDVEEVYLGDGGILAHLAPGSMALDMTTSDPALAEKLHGLGAEKEIAVLDAPVSGGDLGARNATLSIMVGGDNADFERALPILEIMGENIVYQGKAGAGQHTKMSNQIAIAAGMVAMCESLAYAGKAGLDPETVLASIGKGAAGSWSLNNLGPRILKGDYEPGFFVKHFIKDMGIALNSAKAMGLNTPGLELAHSLYKRLAAQGGGDRGTQALFQLFK